MPDPYDSAGNASVLGATLHFDGELSADEDLLILGHVQGTITHSASLTIGREGRVKADVRAEHIRVDGHVEGDLHAAKSVAVRESATVRGNIHAPVVTLLEGAKFNGSIDMQSAVEPHEHGSGGLEAPSMSVQADTVSSGK